MGYMRLRITEELAWMRGSPLYALLTPPNSAAGDDSLQSNLVQVTTLSVIWQCLEPKASDLKAPRKANKVILYPSKSATCTCRAMCRASHCLLMWKTR